MVRLHPDQVSDGVVLSHDRPELPSREPRMMQSRLGKVSGWILCKLGILQRQMREIKFCD